MELSGHTRLASKPISTGPRPRHGSSLTSDAPVSGIRATVRAGRDQMRDVLIGTCPMICAGARILMQGCGTGALAFELAARGADMVGVDISPQLIDIARKRIA